MSACLCLIGLFHPGGPYSLDVVIAHRSVVAIGELIGLTFVVGKEAVMLIAAKRQRHLRTVFLGDYPLGRIGWYRMRCQAAQQQQDCHHQGFFHDCHLVCLLWSYLR